MTTLQDKKIPFHIPFISGDETKNIQDCLEQKNGISRNHYSTLCVQFFKEQYSFEHCLLTNSATAALEMIALMLDIKAGDEIILPSYTFISTANAFLLRGANLVFVDSAKDHPNMDIQLLESKITNKTKAIIAVHYAAMGNRPGEIAALCKKYGIYFIEDAAQCIDAKYNNTYLGKFGDFAVMSFHETKNIHCSEGGLLIINNSHFIERAYEIIEKGSNRRAFINGQVNKYEWVSLGSSYNLPEINAAFLYAQLQQIKTVSAQRNQIWLRYHDYFKQKGWPIETYIPDNPICQHNGHIFYMLLENLSSRNERIKKLSEHGISCHFHYQALSDSPLYKKINPNQEPLFQAIRYSNCLLRLPIYPGLDIAYVLHILDRIIQ